MIDVRNELGESIYCSSSKMFIYRYLQRNSYNPRMQDWIVIHDSVQYEALTWFRMYEETIKKKLFVIYDKNDNALIELNTIESVISYIVDLYNKHKQQVEDYYIVCQRDKSRLLFKDLVNFSNIRELAQC